MKIKNSLMALTIALAAFFTLNMSAQNLELKNTNTTFNKNTYPCIEVFIEPHPDEVKDAWEDFIKDNYDIKMKGNGLFTDKDVLSAEQVNFNVVSNKQMDFYTRIVEDDKHTKMCVFGSFGYDIPISKKEFPNEYEAMENITSRFLKSYLPVYYNEWINKTQERLTDLQDDQKDMHDKIEKNKKEIEELTKENEELVKELVKNKDNLKETSTNLASKKRTFEKITIQLNSLEVSDLKK
jgi:cell division protein FtsB